MAPQTTLEGNDHTMSTTAEPAGTPADVPADSAPQSAADNVAYIDPAIELMNTRAERAAAIRDEEDYDGTLTNALLLKLQPLLNEPTPSRYIVTTPSVPGKPYVSTGINSGQYQCDVMNDVLGVAHWAYRTHYEDGGTVARVFVIVGNNLTGVTLDKATGELVIPEGAEVLSDRDGWGGFARGNGRGDVMKGSETNTLKRVLGRMGPGGDVYRLDVEAEVHGEAPAYQVPGVPAGGQSLPLPAPGQPVTPTPVGAPATAVPADPAAAQAHPGQTKPASEAQVGMLKAKARSKGLPASQMVAIMRIVAGLQPNPVSSEAEAQQVLNDKLPRLPWHLVDAFVQQIEMAQAQPAIIPGPVAQPLPQPGAAAAPQVPQPIQQTGGPTRVGFDPRAVQSVQ